MVKITALVENTAGRICLAEHGLSYYIETENKYLFDTGSSKLFIENANRLQIDLNEVKTVIFSHGHDDHTGGISFLEHKTIVAHPALFMKRYRKRNGTSLGIKVSQKELEQKNNRMVVSADAIQLDQQTWFLGEIPRITDFEAKTSAFVDEVGNEDFIPDDSGIAIQTEKGLVVISGCAHSGICNMIVHAQKVTNEQRIHAVVGGFHLTTPNEQTLKTIEFLKQLNVQNVIPSHCTAFPAMAEFNKHFPFNSFKTGNCLDF